MTNKSIQYLITVVLIAHQLLGVRGTCSLCGDHPIPDDGLLRKKHGIRCRDLFDDTVSIEDETSFSCQRVQLTAFQTGCCDEEYIPENVCSICPDGSPYHSSMSVPGAIGRDALTCGDLISEASFLDFMTSPGECSDTFLQRSAAWCRCPGHEIECHLCPNDAAPIDLQKTENVLYGWSCESFQYITALLSFGECIVAEQVLEFDAQAFCCEGVEPPGECQFCPSGQEIIHPDKIIASTYGFAKCSDIDESLRMVPTEEACESTKQSFPIEQCCGYPGERSSAEGTPVNGMTVLFFTVMLIGIQSLLL